MRSLLAGIVAIHLAACGSENAPKAAPRPAEDATVSAPRYLVVSLRRIQILDRHPGTEEVVPRRDGDHYALTDYDGRPADQRPEIHTYEMTVAVPEQGPTTFEKSLDDARGYRWLLMTRGWTVEGDKIRLNAYETANAQTRWGDRTGVGPNPLAHDQAAVAVDRWLDAQVAHDRAKDAAGNDYSYWEIEELRFGPITASPPADALRGTPEDPGLQNERRLHWSHADNLLVVP
jgi:hypothetical protein